MEIQLVIRLKTHHPDTAKDKICANRRGTTGPTRQVKKRKEGEKGLKPNQVPAQLDNVGPTKCMVGPKAQLNRRRKEEKRRENK